MNPGVARGIEAFVTERQIRYLMHFTRLINLDSILARGLVPRRKLESEDGCNDDMRLDGTDAVCASIEFPNYRMFYKMRKENPDAQWVILVIKASVLWTTRAVFCRCNAASTLVTAVPLDERMTLEAFRSMYDDFGEIKRVELNILDKQPTNPQAEVLLLDGVPRDAIMGVIVDREDMKLRLQAAYPGFAVSVMPSFFSPRPDYPHWKKVLA